jgi:predicted dinucleotide-binding enzyme
MVFMALASLPSSEVCSRPITLGPIESSLQMQMTTALLMLRYTHRIRNTGL